MRQFSLFIGLLYFTIAATAQNKLTINDAVKLAFENNIELQKQTVELNKAEAEISKSARLPNPILSYSREDLESGNLSFNEWIVSGTLPLNFLWNRWSRVNSKEKAKEVEQLLYERLKTNTAATVRSEYCAALHYDNLSLQFDSFLNSVDKLAVLSKHRLDEGDISDYEYRRILIEVNKIKSVVTEIKLKKTQHFNNLSLLTGLNNDENIELLPVEYALQVEITPEQLKETALENRKDLLAHKRMIESEESDLSYNKMQIIPEMSFTAGYKEQADNFTGTVFQVNVAIPLFERNQLGIEESEIQLDLLNKESIFLEERIKREISEAYSRFILQKNLYENSKENKLGSIFTTAVYSYEQGEIKLVDFIDGMNAYVDGLILQTDLEIDAYSSLFRLEEAVGKEITKIGQ